MMNQLMNLALAMSNLVPLPLNNKELWKRFKTCLVRAMICWAKKWISQKLWLRFFRDFIPSLTPFKIDIMLSCLIMRNFLLNVFKESKILKR